VSLTILKLSIQTKKVRSKIVVARKKAINC
jgi:hypothetical protein